MGSVPFFLLLPFLLAVASVPLELPSPIHVPEDADVAQLGKALAAACADRKWTAESDSGSAVTARREVDGRALRVRIDYSPKEVTFHYVDSQELGYYEEQGAIFVIAKANKWLEQLDGAVRARVRALSQEHGDKAPEVVPLDPAAADHPPGH